VLSITSPSFGRCDDSCLTAYCLNERLGRWVKSKLEKYGNLFVKEIVDYCKEHEPSFPIKEEPHSDKSWTYSVKENQKIYPRAYEPWTKEDDEKLIAEYESGKTIEKRMELFGKQRGGINSRLKKLGLFS